MFEAAELGRKVTKEEYDAEVSPLRAGLIEAQLALRNTGIPVIVIISGADGAGKGETVNRLHEWLDPRGLETFVFGPPSDEERDRPQYWRFWRTLPARGRIGIFFGSWYTSPIIRRVYHETKNATFDQEMARIATFEHLLAEDGALILKFWLHLSKKAQKDRLSKLEKSRKTRWRVSPVDWKHFQLYDRFVKHSERAIRATDTAGAPWILIEAADEHYRELTVGKTLLEALRHRLGNGNGPHHAPATAVDPPAVVLPDSPASVTILDRVDLTNAISTEDYEKEFADCRAGIARQVRKASEKKRSTIAVFEGWDAAGKGGVIRRLVSAMDARYYHVIPIAAPTDEERAHHYLWRFWRHVPRAGNVTIFDRSWYGRVLVERVEGFAREDEWRRAYAEINDFEQQLVEHGIVLMKFWLHISPEEQLRRFEERQQVAYKQYKITDEDWRNRSKWDAYETAVNEMVARTSTQHAPWTVVPSNDKRYARIHVLRTFRERLDEAL